MEIVNFSTLRLFFEQYPEAEAPLRAWFFSVRNQSFHSFADVREIFNSASWVKGSLVFNIGGNKFRLITDPDFEHQTMYIRAILTHKEYDVYQDWEKRWGEQ